MPLGFLLDENLRGPPWNAIRRHNAAGNLPPDVVRVGDPADLPLSSPDGLILAWCEREGRILVSLGYESLPGHLAEHLANAGHSPGIFLIRPGTSLRDVVEALELVSYAGDPADYHDRITYIP